MMRFLFLVVIQLTLIASAYAWPPTFGSEFNFSSAALKEAWLARGRAVNFEGSAWQNVAAAEKDAAKLFGDTIKERCGTDCTVVPHSGKGGATEYKVTFQDGYNFNVSVDPGCVEIQTEPETLAQIQSYESRTQKFIFSIAEELGMNGEGQAAHFNVGLLSAFEGEPKAFLKYFVNYNNLPELSTGVLGNNPGNAPPISHLKPEQRAALARIVDDVNNGKIATVQDVAIRIQNEVYTSSPTWDGGAHYQGISVKYIRKDMTRANDRPFEFRAFRQPKTAHERTLLAELSEKRMAFERADTGPISFLDVAKQESYSNFDLANSFRFYLEEMGEDWDHYKELLPPELQSQPADAFLSGKIDWSSDADVRNVKFYARYLSSSAWVRARMKNFLTSPEAIASGKVPDVLGQAKLGLGVEANSDAHHVVNRFLGAFDPVTACDQLLLK